MTLHYTEKVTIYTNRNLKLSDDLSWHLLYELSTEVQNGVSVDNRSISKFNETKVMTRNPWSIYAMTHNIVVWFADGKDAKP
ncbi:hypothetical protein CEP51_001393 [Fusarium floridanum]|uniref:Uncharacterized protein n=1 Tax=Fusarium floridanum TaxID=1325733 RepID=A0A428SH35_9HYPO|nr:hypothetical protein CEP51_001393 [Fusarium floridanum]